MVKARGGFGYEIGKSNGGGSYGGMGTGGLNGGVPGVTYGDDSITHLLGGSGGGHSIVGSGNSGGGGGAISFKVNGSFDLGTNGVISVRGGAGQSDSDASGAGGSGGAIRIEATSINNGGVLDARGGDALGASSLAGAGGGGRISLLAPGSVTQGLVLLDGGENKSQVFSDYKQSELVGHWNLDDNQSSSVAINSTGNSLLNGNITGNPLRVPVSKEMHFL